MKKVIYILPMIATLSGCASFGGSDQGDGYVKAKNVGLVQTKVIREYVPVPVPGQLMPVPSKVAPADAQLAKKGGNVFLSKEKAVEYANKHAQVYPNQSDFFNAMMTYNYMPGAVYTIYTSPLKITDIVMEPGEKLISQAAGDTLRWQIAQTYSGEGKNVQQHILVKPSKVDLDNTLLITTNKRTYHLVLKSTDGEAYMVSVNWQYPKNTVFTYSGDATNALASDPGYNMDLSDLNFNYKVSMYEGKNIPAWYPKRVFNNGSHTFIEFSKQFNAQSGMPVLVIKGDDGSDQTMVNWRLRGNYMVIDSVVRHAFLQTGVDTTHKTMVEISQGNS
ncbi:P-type conjugative transfer protein TrbG [Thiotrichales bacterium 19S3-7]|nr:P-type conjugative transfer protein TrbG [Thiotrichales bacterium 19S3-7]MCF6802394.1 P-type conjugative transfer protein TrbG [Thiotrichales bacterium 19S3-11]